MLRDSLLLIEKQATRKQINIELVEPIPEEVIRLDPDRMSQVLLNLYLNALEAMTNKGVLTVAARLDPDNRQLVVTVSDNGAGIAAEDLAHVFDPYFTTKSTGTGLGLAIAHNIVETAGGQISIESEIHQGTTIAISWPLAS
jgi:two-component system sensor histidine kinase HydH